MPEYDLAIRGGKVVDGAGNPWYHSDIGVKDGRIVRVGAIDASEADRVIDASGLVVCPGFIDLHTHSDVTVLFDGDAQSKVRQGVTLDVIGESNSVGPVEGPAAEEYREEQQARYAVEVTWSDFTGYFARLMRQGTSINIASSVAPQQIRRAVVGFDNRAAGPDELQMMKSLVARSMEQGAVGISAAWHAGGPEFVEELVEMAKVAARYGGYYGTHVGSEGFEIAVELEKTFEVARSAAIPVHIYHLKIRGRDHWGQIGRVIDMIQAAIAEGLEVTADQYPYTAMQHPWHRLMPRWIQDAPRSETIPIFRDRQFRDRVKEDPEFDQYVKEHGGWEGIVMSVVANEALKPDEGKTVAEIARRRGSSDPAETCFDLVQENGAFPGGVYDTMSEEDVRTVMRLPWVSVASDGSALNGSAAGFPHPRSFGTNVRVLQKYVREEGVLQLEEAIRKMTSLPAQVLRLQDRGLLREGCQADVVIFDPDRVAERGTFENPKQYCAGVEYVLVNGVPVIDGGEHTGARPGMVVYGPGYAPRR